MPAKIDFSTLRDHLTNFEFGRLFVEVLGWSLPASKKPTAMVYQDSKYQRTQIAELADIPVFEVASADGPIPTKEICKAIHKEIAKQFHENLLIFVDKARTQSVWYWVKRQEGKTHPRVHEYFKGQPGDLFLSKLASICFDISEFEDGDPSVVEVARRLQKALDTEPVTKKFFKEYGEVHTQFLDLITGIPNDRERRWYASVLLNRMMFIYFMQRKRFLDRENVHYLQDKLTEWKKSGNKKTFFRGFLSTLFFEGFAKPEKQRSPDARTELGSIPYLNGGLFLRHRLENEKDYPRLDVADKAFENLFDLFGRFTWNLNDSPGGDDNEISPDVLGYIFEKYINQKAFGAYYTRTEITEYLCQRTIDKLVLDLVNTPEVAKRHPLKGVKIWDYSSLPEMLHDLDAELCSKLLDKNAGLPSLNLLDPACGSGAFLVAAMKTLINIYSAITGRIKYLNDPGLTEWLKEKDKDGRSLSYHIKKAIITDNLFGVDIMEEATEICKLRLFLALVASATTVDQLEPLPNIDFNIMAGNSLIGLLRVEDKAFEAQEKEGQTTMFGKTYRELLAEKNRKIDIYRHTAGWSKDLALNRDEIEKVKQEAQSTLNDLLRNEFSKLEIKYEEATWDEKKGKEGKSRKRTVTHKDIKTMRPFHWGYEFDEILNKRGGFDAIITNPPWEIFKPNSKEFFEDHSELVTRKKMSIHDFEKTQVKLLKDPDIREKWLEYLNGYPHISEYYRSADQYKNQISVVNGKKSGTDINLYKLFVEQCANLLRKGGQCGIVIPSGIYTDLGTMQLREMLFNQTELTGLFGFENRKEVFEGVHRSFKFVVLTFEKGGATASFPAAFMRHEADELKHFPEQGALDIDVALVRKLSPDSLSVMEFKNPMDIQIAKKMLQYPLLGEEIKGAWNLHLGTEFHMTNDSHLFKTEPGAGRLPLYEGKMIWQFDHKYAEPRYWVDEKQGRKAVVGRDADSGQKLDYQAYRFGFRDIAASTNERAMVCSILHPNVFCGNTLNLQKVFTESTVSGALVRSRTISNTQMLLVVGIFNSFLLDWMIRQKITSHLNMFYIYQLPIPRLTERDAAFDPIVERAALLTCTSPEFDDLAKEFGLKSHKVGATDPTERAQLRAELDGLVAHLYHLTEEEFAYILTTFPIVPDPVKVAAHNAFRDVERGIVK